MIDQSFNAESRMRKKILLILGGILIVAFSGLTILTYHLGSRWFLSQFLEEKLTLARAVSSAVGGDEKKISAGVVLRRYRTGILSVPD
ncbi:MAG: hypothetical protein KDK33_10820 [Leptospiraceae bacterium]|nr:hypothetical protein [Leptospiraceae bacterium]